MVFSQATIGAPTIQWAAFQQKFTSGFFLYYPENHNTMKTISNSIIAILIALCSLTSCNKAEKMEEKQSSSAIDVTKARMEIEATNKQFAEDFRNADSVSLADHYASNGTFGSVKGKDNLVSTWGSMIRNSFQEDKRKVVFTTVSLASDEEYVVELGRYTFLDNDGNKKDEGKYVVVWKQEDGEWKLYRDNGL